MNNVKYYSECTLFAGDHLYVLSVFCIFFGFDNNGCDLFPCQLWLIVEFLYN